MGRTVHTFNQLVREIKREKWGKYRWALAKADQERLDDLFEMARFHSAPAAYQSHPIPMETIFLGMFLEMLRRLERVEARFPDLDRYEGCPPQGELDL